MNNTPELPINIEARNDAHIPSQGMRMYLRTAGVATSKNKTGN